MIAANTDDLESIQLDQQEEEEEMDELVINKNNYKRHICVSEINFKIQIKTV